MAKNTVRFVGNLFGLLKPLIKLGLFQAGATQEIKRGELLELTADTNTRWVPLDSDFAMSANIAIANEEIKDGDRQGYYEIIVPRPGDIFEFALDTPNNPAVGTPVYFSDSETVSETGTNILGHVAGQQHYPLKQGHLSDDASPDSGEVIKDTDYVRITIEESNSWYSLLQQG